MQSEKQLQNNVIKFLKTKAPDLWYMKVHGGIFQKSGIPDIIGSYNGQFFAIELKRLNGRLSKLQMYEMHIMSNAGVEWVVACNMDTVKNFIAFLENKYKRRIV